MIFIVIWALIDCRSSHFGILYILALLYALLLHLANEIRTANSGESPFGPARAKLRWKSRNRMMPEGPFASAVNLARHRHIGASDRSITMRSGPQQSWNGAALGRKCIVLHERGSANIS
jgi:hypothetical protein